MELETVRQNGASPQNCGVDLPIPVIVVILHFSCRSCLRLADQAFHLEQDRRDFSDHFANFLEESIARVAEAIEEFLNPIHLTVIPSSLIGTVQLLQI